MPRWNEDLRIGLGITGGMEPIRHTLGGKGAIADRCRRIGFDQLLV